MKNTRENQGKPQSASPNYKPKTNSRYMMINTKYILIIQRRNPRKWSESMDRERKRDLTREKSEFGEHRAEKSWASIAHSPSQRPSSIDTGLVTFLPPKTSFFFPNYPSTFWHFSYTTMPKFNLNFIIIIMVVI